MKNISNSRYRPVLTVPDYGSQDGPFAPGGEISSLSLGLTTDTGMPVVCLHENPGITALPVHRALDLTLLILAGFLPDARVLRPVTSMQEGRIPGTDLKKLINSYYRQRAGVDVRLYEIRRLLNYCFHPEKPVV